MLEIISSKFEYRNAAFSRENFIDGSMNIYTDMIELGETELKITVDDFKKHFDEKFDTGHYIEMGQLREDTYFSTEQNIRIENEIYEKAPAAKNQVSGFERDKVRKYLENTTLNEGQQYAMMFMATCKDRIKAIQGDPGVGKSFMLNVAKNFYEEEGYKVVALAPSNKAVLNLKESAGFEDAATVHSYLIKLQKEAGTWETGRDPLDLRLTNLEGLTPGIHKEIWFVDEASLIDNYTMNKLLQAAKLKNAEVIPTGDMNQLQPVGSGKPFTNMLRKNMLEYVEVKEILRQKEEWKVYGCGKLSEVEKQALLKQAKKLENNAAVKFFKGSPSATASKQQNPQTYRIEKFMTSSGSEIEIHKDSSLKEAVKDAVDHNIAGSLNKLDSRITEIEDNAERLQTIADRYATLPADKRDKAVIITATNKDRIAINDLVRGFLKHNGELGEGYDFSVTDILGKKQIREFSPGDKIIFLKKEVFDGHLINKDDVGDIKEIAGKNITVTTRGKEIVIPADKYNHIDHANCRTTYRVQGADYDTVYANINTYQSLINSRNDFLVKISRAKHKLEIFTDDRGNLYNAIKNEQFKVSIADFVDRVYVKEASKIIDDRLVEKIYNRSLDDPRLQKKVKVDLQQGDFHYINYFKLMDKAKEYQVAAKAFSGDKEKYSSLHSKAESFKEKALGHKAQSEFFYQRALDNYSRTMQRQIGKVSTAMPKGAEMNQFDITGLKQRFVDNFIPVGNLSTLDKIVSDNSPFISLESKISGDNLSMDLENADHDYFMDPHFPGISQEQMPPGFDNPGVDQEKTPPGFDNAGEDGGIPRGDGGEGDESGPGISFGI